MLQTKLEPWKSLGKKKGWRRWRRTNGTSSDIESNISWFDMCLKVNLPDLHILELCSQNPYFW